MAELFSAALSAANCLEGASPFSRVSEENRRCLCIFKETVIPAASLPDMPKKKRRRVTRND